MAQGETSLLSFSQTSFLTDDVDDLVNNKVLVWIIVDFVDD